uniref:Uncharacterized protein n=1 Tax=Brassica campestris TaxID=3711 RepID=M4EC17_BRACM
MNTLLGNLKGQIPSIDLSLTLNTVAGERTSCRREDASSNPGDIESVKKKLYVAKVWVQNFKKFKSSIMPMSMDPYGGEFQGTVGRSSKGRFSKSFGKPCTKSKCISSSTRSNIEKDIIFSDHARVKRSIRKKRRTSSIDTCELAPIDTSQLESIKTNLRVDMVVTLVLINMLQKSTRCAEKSGTGDDLGGQYKEKLPIRIKFPSPCRLGRIPTVSLARAVVYSTSNSAMITMEIMIDEIIEEE